MQYTIEQNFMMPTAPMVGRQPKYPLKFMKVGDSFAYERENHNNILQASYKVRNSFNYRFAWRKMETGFRIWRIA